MFGLVMLLLSILQVTAVPAWNQGEEFDHSQQVRNELELLRDDISRTAARGRTTSSSVTLGTRYPRRPFLLNPADPSGRLRTTEEGIVQLENLTARGETGHYWTNETRTFTTRHLTYRPDYNEYDNAPTTVLENGVLYDRHGNRSLPLTSPTVVSGRQITLVTLNGSLEESGTAATDVELTPLSAPQQVTSVEGDGPVRIRLPTRMDESTWEGLLEDEFVDNGGNVYDNVTVSDGEPYDTVTITLRGNRTYDLRLAEVGVGNRLASHEPRYLTVESSPELRLAPGDNERLVFEVRDAYNNPVSGVQVNASRLGGRGALVPVDNVTDADGHATFRYTAGSAGTETIEASFNNGSGPAETATVTVQTTVPATSANATGPVVSDIDTNATAVDGETVLQGQVLTLTANASDFQRGGTDIYAVEWWSNRTDPGGSEDNGFPFVPADGTFDTVEESANASGLDTADWTPGTHELSVRAQDADGNWGPVETYTVTVEPATGTVEALSATASGRNDIDVEVSADGAPAGAEIEVRALGTQRTTRVPVTATQPQTVTIGGQRQATGILVVLYDGNTELDRDELAYS